VAQELAPVLEQSTPFFSLHTPATHSRVVEHAWPVKSSPLATGEHDPELVRFEHGSQASEDGAQKESSQAPDTHSNPPVQAPAVRGATQAPFEQTCGATQSLVEAQVVLHEVVPHVYGRQSWAAP